jgi:hypothetical protein
LTKNKQNIAVAGPEERDYTPKKGKQGAKKNVRKAGMKVTMNIRRRRS